MVLDPQNPVSWSPTLEGGVVAFTAPELIVPPKFGLSNSTPTKEGDIYAFGFVILQVKYCTIATFFSLTVHQVLVGKRPYYGVQRAELMFCVVNGNRPDKPVNAEEIGISDPLWKLVQMCWDGDRLRRPRMQEVVEEVGDAAANWNTDMPPTPSDDGGVFETDPVSSEYSGFTLFPMTHGLFSGTRTGIFHSSSSDGRLPVDRSTDGSGPSNTTTLGTERPSAETPETHRERILYPYLPEDFYRPPPYPLPKKRKGLKYYLNSISTSFDPDSKR